MELTQALEEATELAGGLCDVQVKLHGKERQGLRTQRHHQHLVFSRIALLEPRQGKRKHCLLKAHCESNNKPHVSVQDGTSCSHAEMATDITRQEHKKMVNSLLISTNPNKSVENV